MSSDLINNLSSREHYFRNAVEGEFTANVLQAARFEIERQSELLEECREALRPFLGVRDQFPETIKLISPKLDGLSPIAVTVTKAQFLAGLATLARLSSQTPDDEGE